MTSSRSRILEAATSMFQKYGYHGTSIQKISEAAGIGRGTLYHHIDSKEHLLYQISISLFRSIADGAEAIATSDDGAHTKLRRLAEQIIGHPATKSSAWSVALRDAHVLTEEHHEEVLTERRRFEDQWRNVFAEGTAEGLWAEVSEINLRGILGMFNSTARWVRADGPLGTREIADSFLDVILNGLKHSNNLQSSPSSAVAP